GSLHIAKSISHDAITSQFQPDAESARQHHRASVLDLTPGVRHGHTTIYSAEAAAMHAISLAEEAVRRGTFGVGGFLLDAKGKVIVEAVNAVVQDDTVLDPTAHVERQLVDWVAEARSRGVAISTSELTIVCSVDPCAMCAGAILRSGIRIVAVAEDKLSGVHEAGRPHRMPTPLWNAAEKQMALFGVHGVRSPAGDHPFNSEISADLLRRAEEAFSRSVEPVNRSIS